MCAVSGLSCSTPGSSSWHVGSFIAAWAACCCTGCLMQGAGFSLVLACGFSLSSCGWWGPEHMGSVVCSMQALLLRRTSSVVVVHRLSCPMACSPTRDWTCAPCIGRWILHHWTTREVPQIHFQKHFSHFSLFSWKSSISLSICYFIHYG